MSNIIDQLREMNKKKKEQTPTVKFKPVEKPKVITPEATITTNRAPVNSLTAKLKGLGSEAPKFEDPKKIRIKENYKKILENQLKAGNLVLKESVSTINKVFLDVMKEDESYNIDEDLLQSERRNKALVRAERKKYLEVTKDQLVKAISRDINEHFSRRYQAIDNIPVENIEIIKKIKVTERDIVYYTDEGEYTIDGKKAESFGGYLHLNRRFLTEYLDLDKLSLAIKKDNNSSRIAETKAWLMMSPLVVPTEEGKILLAPTDYIEQTLVEYVDNIKSRQKSIKAFHEKVNYKKQEKDVEEVYKPNPRKIIEDLMMFKEPFHSSLIYYPYNSMPDNGIELELDIDFTEISYIQTLNKLHYESMDFISWENLKSAKENADISDIINRAFLDLSQARDKITSVDSIPNVLTIEDKVDKDEVTITGIDEVEEINSLIRKASNATEDDSEDEEDGKDKKSKVANTADEKKKAWKAFKKKCEDCFNTVSYFRFDQVDEVIRILNESMYSEKDYTQELGRILSALNALKNREMFKQIVTPLAYYCKNDMSVDIGIDRNLYQTIEEEKVETIIEGRVTDFLIRVNQTLSEFGEFYDEYLEKVKEIGRIQNIVGKAIKIPWLSNLSLDVDTGTIPLKLAPVVLNTLVERVPELEEEVKNIRKSADPILSNKLRNVEYEKIRTVVKAFGDRVSVNWFEILKVVALVDSSLNRSYIKTYPDVKELINIPELRGDMARLNSLGKFIAANNIPSEQEDNFNQMFNEIAISKKGLLCAIDYRSLASYLVEEEDLYKGEDLVRFIPNVRIVDKYFPITESSKVYPKIYSERLALEIGNIPAVYLALHHILDTIKYNISFDSGMFKDNFDDIMRYSELKYQLENERYSMRFIDELNALYDAHDRSIKLLIGLAKSERIETLNRSLKDVMSDFINTLTEREKNLDKESSTYEKDLQNIKESINKFNEYYKEGMKSDEDAKVLKEDQEEKLRQKRENILAEMNVLKDKIDESVGKELNSLIDKVDVFYNRTKSYGDLQAAWKYYDFDKFTKGRVLLNFIVTYVADYSDITQAAIFNIIREFLIDCKDRENILKQNNLTRPDVVSRMFEFVAFTLKLKDVLKLNSSDEIEISTSVEDTTGGMSKEDEQVLVNFLNNLQGKTDIEVINSFKAFSRKDLIADDLYLKVVYDDQDTLEKIYPRWYNRDFNIAENIKIMLECGVAETSLNPEHLADKKLMEIVNNTEVDKDLIARLKDYMA